MTQPQQIKSNQITSLPDASPNPSQGPPRDLILDNVTLAPVPVVGLGNQNNVTTTVGAPSGTTVGAQPPIVLGTPSILELKSQTINFNPDGSASVDAVITVTDIQGSQEYDVRIAKVQGVV